MKHTKTWILVADAGRARVLERSGAEKTCRWWRGSTSTIRFQSRVT